MRLWELCLACCIFVFASYGNPTKEDTSGGSYFNMDPLQGNYDFGYNVRTSGPFHFEKTTLERVAFGCYGVNGAVSRRLQVTYYVADDAGYRVIQPYLPTEILVNSIVQLRTWQQLAMPAECTNNNQEVQHDLLGSVLTPIVGGLLGSVTGLLNGLVGGLGSLGSALTTTTAAPAPATTAATAAASG